MTVPSEYWARAGDPVATRAAPETLETRGPVRPQEGGKMLIRANAIFNNEPITDPKIYQNFFATLERSMFIGRN